MKRFKGSITYRGASFFLKFCASSQTEAAKRADETTYQVRVYYSKVKPDEIFPEIQVEPYGTRAVKLFGRDHFAVNNITEFYNKVNDKIQEQWEKQ